MNRKKKGTTKSKRFQATFKTEVRNALEYQSKREGLSMNEYVAKLIMRDAK